MLILMLSRRVVWLSLLVVVLLQLVTRVKVTAFTVTRIAQTRAIPGTIKPSSSQLQSSFLLPDLPNINVPFFGKGGSSKNDDEEDEVTSFEPTPAGLVFQAKRVIANDLGLLDPSVLDDSKFRWIDGSAAGPPTTLSKTEYVAAGRFFNLRGTFPDIDYRSHDFRVATNEDGEMSDTVRVTCRIQGTMKGELRLRNDIVVPPSGLVMKCPPEAVSITFDTNTGKVTKLCTGFVLDRLVGNTKGTTGVVAASIIAGQPSVSDWDLYPPSTIVSRIFARPQKPLGEAESFLAPFPEQVMISLAKGVIGTNLGADDPSLLKDRDFTFLTPTKGPIGKQEFLNKYAKQEFENISDPGFSSFRVDPYDPVRVWVDLQPSAPGYQGPPQVMSFSFDDDGYCTRITSWAVMDPSIGNAGGLGGPEGYKYALGNASLGLRTRSIPTAVGRLKKRLFSVFTGVNVDDYVPASGLSFGKKVPAQPKRKVAAPPSVASAFTRVAASPPPVTPKQAPSVVEGEDLATSAAKEREAAANAVMKRLEALKDFSASIRIEPPSIPSISILPPQPAKSAAEEQQVNAEKDRRAKVEAAKKQQQQAAAAKASAEAAAENKKRQLEAQKKVEAQKKAAAAAEAQKKKAAAAAQADRQKKAAAAAAAEKKAMAAAQAEAQRKAAVDKKVAAAAQAEAQRKAAAAQAEADRKAAAEKKAAEQKKQEQERKAKDKLASVKAKVTSPNQSSREERAVEALSKATSRATISLFGLGKSDDDEEEEVLPKTQPKKTTKQAPPGVPSLTRWKRNTDNSITGLVRGSSGFKDGQRITTSPIKSGTISNGEVVRTGSGSRYFLE